MPFFRYRHLHAAVYRHFEECADRVEWLARVGIDVSDFEPALEHLRVAADAVVTYANPRLQRARLLKHLGRARDAQTELSGALELCTRDGHRAHLVRMYDSAL